nr:hypothetical protein [Mesorhizobium erdmanii]
MPENVGRWLRDEIENAVLSRTHVSLQGERFSDLVASIATMTWKQHAAPKKEISVFEKFGIKPSSCPVKRWEAGPPQRVVQKWASDDGVSATLRLG